MKPLVFLLAVIAVSAGVSVSQGGWSVNNPYRTYNLTGLNYGAQNWEQQHRGNRAVQTTRPRLLRRR